ncbi:MAG TPA: acyltransferase [Bacteroidota bacterium]|nr:acyltransferase [Bacteroidota bacterium]
MKGKIAMNGELSTGRVLLGFPHVPIFDEVRSRTVWNQIGGLIVFQGTAKIGHGSKLAVNGYLEIGDKFEITAESTIIAYNRIVIEPNVLISWDVLVMDTDFHRIYDENGKLCNEPEEIIIGAHSWIGCRVSILKGVYISKNAIVASGSVVVKSLLSENAIYAGIPALMKGRYSFWDH